ncbi:hypothetical protein CVU82_02575 [Candidatus Falkowbacteria bacterium HGW-Falkowbacteria-1]|uniref:UDP-N-acetylglucosamine--N-acetylmuramyl-(pentapeptide) pyrophosphoryl-undecaprenol N-acetylglucosamine transferase n=1 Tax=Candidatus Falkowbacteria bacterium HGW-Falkowbacteria-1 TaxID=2013768 RepID=A0A2N2E9R5_9BACT|nr:MAG: hypothetical protein CVU82_02575 [Candidatus Falkowbacteria bacterium HGW-Falkowbacteria-1]
MKDNKKKKIILSGGGTGGSVVPLFFISRELKNDFDFIFVGTYDGLEREMVAKENMEYVAILSGKFRRYFSVSNFIDLFKIFGAFWQSLFFLMRERPSILISAGAFVSVPLVFASWLLKIPVLIHQQDVEPGLANKLMAPFAKVITVTFDKSLGCYGKRARLIGNIGFDAKNKTTISRNNIFDKYNLNKDLPLVLILGGGTGSLFINSLVSNSVKDLSLSCNIVHISGDKSRDIKNDLRSVNYLKFSFMDHDNLMDLMTVSDLIVSRCGLSTLTEISFLKKAAILIPMPNSHQENNADEFSDGKGAVVLEEKRLSSEFFIENIEKILNDRDGQQKLGNNASKIIKNGNQGMIAIIKSLLR